MNQSHIRCTQLKDKNQGVLLENVSFYVVGILAAIFSLFLFVTSMQHTTVVELIAEGVDTIVYHIRPSNESVNYYHDNFIVNLIVLALFLTICFIIIAKQLKKMKLRNMVLFVFLWTFILGTIWVLSSQSAPTGDSYELLSASMAFAENDFSVLENSQYFKYFPFQLGYVLFNELLLRFILLFKRPETFMIFEVFNALFLAIINSFVVLINHRIFKDENVTKLTAVILALSVAPMISCTFVYGILPGMMFAVIAIYCELRWLQDNRYIFAILSICCIAIAVLIKSNYLIWLIALVLMAGILMFRRKKYFCDSLLIVLAITLSLSMQPSVKKLYEYRSGIDLGDSIPYTSWIAMGLNESAWAPGWYNKNYTISNFNHSDCDAKTASQRSMNEIKERIKYFVENPQYANDFFYLKTVSQWNDTTYQSIWNNVVRDQYKEKNSFANWVCYTGVTHVRRYIDYLTQFVFFAFFAGCVFAIRDKKFLYLWMPLIFLGGFLYHLISEGKSQYIMPYYILMSGFSAYGIVCIYKMYLNSEPGKRHTEYRQQKAGEKGMMSTNDGFELLSKYRKAIMGFAALWIWVFHEWVVVFHSPTLSWLEVFIRRIGFLGVDIFFFLSGIGLVNSLKRHSIPQFYYRRVRRIILPFLAVALIRFVNEHWTVSQLLGNISGINFYTKSIYSFLWFVPAIVTLYLLFPLYHRLFSSASNKVVFTLSVLIIWLIFSIALNGTLRSDLYGFTNRLPVFFVGCLCGWLSQKRKYQFEKSTWILLLLVLGLGLYLSWLTNFKGMPLLVPTPNCCIPNLLIATSLCFLLPKAMDLMCSTNLLGLKKLSCILSRSYAFLGAFTLEFYCVQEYLGGILKPIYQKHMGPLSMNILLLFSTLFASWILYYAQTMIWKFIDFLAAKRIPKIKHQ